MITSIIAYTDDFDSVCENAKDKLRQDGALGELSPDNTIGDFISVIAEMFFRELAGDVWNMTLGDLAKLSEEEQEKILGRIVGDRFMQEFIPKK